MGTGLGKMPGGLLSTVAPWLSAPFYTDTVGELIGPDGRQVENTFFGGRPKARLGLQPGQEKSYLLPGEAGSDAVKEYNAAIMRGEVPPPGVVKQLEMELQMPLMYPDEVGRALTEYDRQLYGASGDQPSGAL